MDAIFVENLLLNFGQREGTRIKSVFFISNKIHFVHLECRQYYTFLFYNFQKKKSHNFRIKRPLICPNSPSNPSLNLAIRRQMIRPPIRQLQPQIVNFILQIDRNFQLSLRNFKGLFPRLIDNVVFL